MAFPNSHTFPARITCAVLVHVLGSRCILKFKHFAGLSLWVVEVVCHSCKMYGFLMDQIQGMGIISHSHTQLHIIQKVMDVAYSCNLSLTNTHKI